MSEFKPLFSRVCEPSCGLLAKIKQNKLARLTPDSDGRLNRISGYAGLSIEALQQAPQQTLPLPEIASGRFYDDWIQTADQRVDYCPSLFEDAFLATGPCMLTAG